MTDTLTKSNSETRLEQASRLLKPFPLLALFYLLPEKMIRDEIRLEIAPRCPLEFIADDFFMRIYLGKMFPKRMMKLWARLIWESKVVSGFAVDYSEHEPIQVLIHDPDTCIKVLASLGYDTDWLARQSVTIMDIPYPSEEKAAERLAELVQRFWEHDKSIARKIYEIARAHRTHNDFTDRKSHARIDFHRKYYHTRTKSKLVSIQNVWEDVEYVADVEYNMENVIAADWVLYFYKWLNSGRDVAICKLRYMGFTQKQIAALLKYKNHSGVNKRIKLVRGILEACVEWQQKLYDNSSTPPPPKLLERNCTLYQPKDVSEQQEVRYDIIEFTYKRTMK